MQIASSTVIYKYLVILTVAAYDKKDKDTAEFLGNIALRYANKSIGRTWKDIYPPKLKVEGVITGRLSAMRPNKGNTAQ